MAYEIKIAAPARQDVDDAVTYTALHSPEAAARWYDGLWKVINSLEEMPLRFAVIPEANFVGSPYHAALYKPYRIIFRVDETTSTVLVLRVYHGSRRPLTLQDLVGIL